MGTDKSTAIRKELSALQRLRTLIRHDRRFPMEAYLFVFNALDVAQAHFDCRGKHVTGQELLEGIHVLASDMFGPLSPVVFRRWNINESKDFGRVVFNMVRIGLMGQTDDDSLDDFDGGFDVMSAFDQLPGNLSLGQRLSPIPASSRSGD